MSVVCGGGAAMNEMTWATVQQWERLHHECDNPRLSRFIGRPHDLSPLGAFLLAPIQLALRLTTAQCSPLNRQLARPTNRRMMPRSPYRHTPPSLEALCCARRATLSRTFTHRHTVGGWLAGACGTCVQCY